MNVSHESSPSLVLRFLREQVRPYLILQLEIGLCLLIGVALALADPLILKVILDRALGDRDMLLLLILCGSMLVVLAFRSSFQLLTVWLYSYSGLRILFDFRRRVFEHVMGLSSQILRGERTGDVMARLTTDIDVLQRAAAHTVVNGAQDLLTIGGILALLVWLDPVLTGILVLVYPLLVALLALLNRRLQRESVAARGAIAGLYAFLEERLRGLRLIQEFGREKGQARQHVRISRPWIASNLSLSVIGAGQVALADVTHTTAFILVFLLGGMRVISGALTLGGLVAFYTLASRLYRPISGLIDINIDLQVARASLARVYGLIDLKSELTEVERPVVVDPVEGSYRLDGVGLDWPDGSRALDGLNLTIEAGEFVALVGPSGSGKTTLASLLARYMDPTRGRVSLDGLDLKLWSLAGLRRVVGVVSQETVLFNDTLAANLRLARPEATDEQLWDVLEVAGLARLVERMPDQLETSVAEQGLRLSGGERQRLALARMLLKDPRIVILDEATSALDTQTEMEVLEALHKRVAGRTLIAIAHRLSAVAGADRILVLDGGRLAAAGRHDELLREGGLYRRLYDQQLRGEEAD